jgi:CheY-like chemotaxis protein
LPTILAIDDDSAALTTLATTLEHAGYDVRPISSLDQARRFLDDNEPDLIVLEIDADQGAGWKLLRDIVYYQGPPTIIVSRRGREEEIVEALAIGAADFLPKPYRSNELIARVRARLGQPPIIEETPPRTPSRRTVRPVDEEPPFMAHADEQTLMAERGAPIDDGPADEGLPLGRRFHEARQRRKLSLVQVNLETRIPIWYLQAMEDEKFSLLPRGPAAQQMIQEYAAYLRLDVARALADYRAHHDTAPFRPMAHLGGAPAPRQVPIWVSVVVAAILALAIGGGALWWLVGDSVPVLRSNLRGLIAPPGTTETVTPEPAPEVTVTPEPAGGVLLELSPLPMPTARSIYPRQPD